MRTKTTLGIFVFCIVTLFAALPAYAEGGTRSECLSKSTKMLADLDKWIGQYERQMDAAEPVQKPKYEEWIRELNKLKAHVKSAKSKLEDKSVCSDDKCVPDQCNLVDIADQQVGSLVKETEEQLGATSKLGEKEGKEVTYDDDTLGDDSMIDNYDPNDAVQPNSGEKSESSDAKVGGTIGDVFDDSADPDQELPAQNQKEQASPL